MQDLKTLIIGAGVAGLSCAGLLEKQGLSPTIIEKEKKECYNDSGYMLGLLPLGGRVLNALDSRGDYFEESIQMESYEIHRPDGSLIKNYPLDFINKKYGSYRGISRTKLIEVLLGTVTLSNIKYDTTVEGIDSRADGNSVTFSDGQARDYDLVIVADGIHSQTRGLVLDDEQYSYYDTGWGGWVTWLNQHSIASYKEYWGNGSFLGLYPVKDRIGIFLGGTVSNIKNMGLNKFKNEVQKELSTNFELPNQALGAFDEVTNPFFWEFHDCRSETWHKSNVVLLGDAATGFLPTAGVGASMAMDSAAALVDELSRADRDHLNYSLNLYSKRQKERVEKAQDDSRSLGKTMLIDSTIKSKIRNAMLPFYSLEQMLSDLVKVMEGD